MVFLFTDQELSDLARTAVATCGGENTAPLDYSFAPAIVAYCAEMNAHLVWLRPEDTPPETREKAHKKLTFFNAVMGRVAKLEAPGNLENTSYHLYDTPDGQNQVDLFLRRLGYKRMNDRMTP